MTETFVHFDAMLITLEGLRQYLVDQRATEPLVNPVTDFHNLMAQGFWGQ